ncbi:hypothetical protein ACHAXA_001220 [Cyclostephanos tholiformis]|uniref:Uncharacterized protein n=1 Tax=Cyclostephanos tholiformis TaxID=382380 RepID=A0ABD3SQ36_9STRA
MKGWDLYERLMRVLLQKIRDAVMEDRRFDIVNPTSSTSFTAGTIIDDRKSKTSLNWHALADASYSLSKLVNAQGGGGIIDVAAGTATATTTTGA